LSELIAKMERSGIENLYQPAEAYMYEIDVDKYNNSIFIGFDAREVEELLESKEG